MQEGLEETLSSLKGRGAWGLLQAIVLARQAGSDGCMKRLVLSADKFGNGTEVPSAVPPPPAGTVMASEQSETAAVGWGLFTQY